MKTNSKRGHLLMTKAIATVMPELYSTDGEFMTVTEVG